MSFFDLKKEEQFTTNQDDNVGSSEEVTFEYGLNPVDDFLMDCDIADMGSNIEKMSNELVLLTKVDNGCARLEENLKNGLVTFESALNEFKDSIDGSGFTLESFGLNDENLTVESAVLTFESGESRLTKIWNWIKEKIQAIKNWFVKLWNTLFGKSKKLEKIADELEKQIEAIPEGGFTSESALTHESGEARGKLYYKEIKHIPGAQYLYDLKFIASGEFSGLKSLKTIDILEIFKNELSTKQSSMRGKDDINSSILKNIFKKMDETSGDNFFTKITNIKVDKNSICVRPYRLTSGQEITFSYIDIKDRESLIFSKVFDFNYNNIAKITKQTPDNKELEVFSKSDLLGFIKNRKKEMASEIEYNKSRSNKISALVQKISDLCYARLKDEDKQDNRKLMTSSDCVDIINFVDKLVIKDSHDMALMLDIVESIYRILAIHVKKHYQNQHPTK